MFFSALQNSITLKQLLIANRRGPTPIPLCTYRPWIEILEDRTVLNNAPILNPIGAMSINELSVLTFTATATDSDVPAQPLT